MPIQSSSKLVLVLGLALLCAGCGDTFRPVATPLTGAPPDAQAFHLAITVSANTAGSPGSNSSIDVSGDSRFSTEVVGNNPVHAALLPTAASTRVYVANQGDNTVSSYSPTGQATPVTTTLLPAGAAPNFVHTTEAARMYVSMPGLNSVGAIDAASNVLKATIPVGTNPVALAETGDGKRIYSVNQGSNNLTGINTADDTVTTNSPLAVGNTPVWGVFSSGGLLYVLNQGDGTISIIDPGADAVVGTPLTVAVGANFMLFDKRLNRLYVTNPVANSLTIFDLSQPTAVLLATVPVSPGPVSVTALADGTRAYVASFQSNGTTVNSTITVIDATSNSVKKTVPVSSVGVVAACNSARFRLATASSADSSKVYVANCDAGGTSIIRTSDDTMVTTLPSPQSAQPPARQNPVWVLATQ